MDIKDLPSDLLTQLKNKYHERAINCYHEQINKYSRDIMKCNVFLEKHKECLDEINERNRIL